MTRFRRWRRAGACLVLPVAVLAASGCGSSGSSTPGVTDSEIKIGMTLPLSGPVAGLGGALKAGAEAYFAKVNAEGGVAGRKIRLTALDDQYSPARAVTNAHQLLEREKVFTVLAMGVPGGAAIPVAQKNDAPLFIYGGQPLSGDHSMTRMFWPEIDYEAVIDTRTTLAEVRDPKIGVLGVAGDATNLWVEGVKRELKAAGKPGALVKVATVAPTETTVTSEIDQLRAAGVNVLMTIPTAPIAISGAKYMKQIGWKPMTFLYSATTSSKTVMPQIGVAGERFRTALWLTDPASGDAASSGELASYFATVKKYGKGSAADPTNVDVADGYGLAEVLVTLLKSEALKDPTRKGLLRAWDGIRDVPVSVLVGKANVQPDKRIVDTYQPSVFDGTRWTAEGAPARATDTSAP